MTGDIQPSLRTGGGGGDKPHVLAYGGNNQRGPIDVATAVNAHGGPHGRQDFESETFIAHALRGEGFDASEDGTGRGTPLVPVMEPLPFDPRQIHHPANHSSPKPGDVCHPLRAAGNAEPAIAFSCKDHGGGDAPTLTSNGDAHSGYRDDRGLVPVAFNITPSNSNKDYNARESHRAQALTAGGNRPSARGGDLIAAPVAVDVWNQTVDGDIAATLNAESGAANHSGPKILHPMAVRRLTPAECEALQGFPRNYTAVTYRGKPAADGPRYKALGNSMAVPVMAWIGQRIQMVEDLDGAA